jgi:hypothetical protein
LDFSLSAALQFEQRKRAFQRKYEIKNNLNKLLQEDKRPYESIDLYLTKAVEAFKHELNPHIDWNENTDISWALD